MDIKGLDAVKTGDSSIDDRLALAEAQKFIGESKRGEQKKTAIHIVTVGFIVVLSVLASIVIWVRVLHFILPADWLWLTEPRLKALDEIFFHGTIGVALFGFLRKCFDIEEEKKKE